jgi:membrane fusion protein (multidrug efflux system)
VSDASAEGRAPGPVASPRLRARRAGSLALLAAALVVSMVWGGRRLHFARSHVSTDNAQVDGHVVPILAKVGGYVSDVLVEDNEVVARGDPVVVIDDAELRVRLAETKADLAAAVAAAGGDGVTGLVQAEAAGSHARREALEARLVSASAQRDRAVKDLGRARELADKQIASRQQLDAAQAAADAAEAEVSALERDVVGARAAESSAEASGRAAEARVAKARAAVERVKLDLSWARVGAPVSGVVTRTQVEVGQLVQPGQPLAAVVADSAVWITANLKETETAEVRVGQPVDLEVDAYPGCAARGAVESLSPATGARFALIPPDNATGNFTKVVQRIPVRIAVTEGCGEGRPLRPGMSVVSHIEIR